MHLQWFGRERRVENWDSVGFWKCISKARSRMRTNQYQRWRWSSTTYMGPHIWDDLTSQMPTIKMNLRKKQKIYAQSTLLRRCSRCADYRRDWKTLLQFSGIALNQHSRESNMLWSLKTMCWCTKQSDKEQFDKRMLAVKSRLRVEKIKKAKSPTN